MWKMGSNQRQVYVKIDELREENKRLNEKLNRFK